MKHLMGIGLLGLMFTFTACEQGQDQRTSEQVLEVDTTGVEYEVERTVKERQVDVDTTTETQTIEREMENEQQGQNQ